MKIISKKLGLRLAALTAATVGLSGCVYDAGLGYASDGYGYNDYDCDPYSAFDSYYDCDNSYGFYNIGFGGGWYDSYWYPGHGYYVFDNYGRRFNMRDNHRRYWGDRRHRWYRDNRGHNGGHGYGRGRDHDDHRGNGRGHDRSDDRGHSGGDRGSGAVGNGSWDGRNNDRDDRRGGRGDGRRGRDNGANNGQGNGAVGQPDPQPMARPGPDRRGERGGRGDGQGRGRYQQPAAAAPQNAAPQPQQPQVRQERPARQRDVQQTARPRPDPAPRQDAPDRLPD